MKSERYYFLAKTGEYVVYYSYETLLQYLSVVSLEYVGNSFKEGRGVGLFVNPFYVVYDSKWKLVHVSKLKVDLDKYVKELHEKRVEERKKKSMHSWWYQSKKHRYVFRKDPVPGTGSWRHYGRSFRHPKTTQERRTYCREDKEFIRAKRNISNLPSSWEDIYRSDNLRRPCWKNKKKKKQWM